MTTMDAHLIDARPAHRLAGGALLLVGALNVLFGILSLTTATIALSGGIASTLIAAGLLLASTGVLVARGSTVVAAVALGVVTVLLLVEVGNLAATAVEPAGQLPRIAVLAVLVATLVPAVRSGRRRKR